MGAAKHTLRDDQGFTWLERTVNILAQYTENIAISGDGDVPESLCHLTRISDVPGVSGPLTGLLSAMRWQPTLSWLLVACDMPNINEKALRWLKQQRFAGAWAVQPKKEMRGYVEPLLGLYDFRCASLCEELVRSGSFRLGTLSKKNNVKNPIIPETLRKSWNNINTPDELQAQFKTRR